MNGCKARRKDRITSTKSTGVSQNQPIALLEFAVHLTVYGKVYSRPSAIVAYTNNGYLRDA
jgi:hypothetical protein